MKLYYHMNELCYVFNVRPSAIRYWCDVFGINPKRNKKGNRLFRESEMQKIRKIHRLLKIERYTIEGAKMQLN